MDFLIASMSGRAEMVSDAGWRAWRWGGISDNRSDNDQLVGVNGVAGMEIYELTRGIG